MLPQDGGFPYRLGLIGDLGQTENSAQTLEHLMANRPASVLNVGDLSYADGEQRRWDTYGRLVQPSTAAVPHMTIEASVCSLGFVGCCISTSHHHWSSMAALVQPSMAGSR